MKLVKNSKTIRRPVKSDIAAALRALDQQAPDMATVLVVYETKDGTLRSFGSRMRGDTRLFLAEWLAHATRAELFGDFDSYRADE